MRTILVVEDEKSLRESLADMLAINGYKVRTAENGLQGLEVLAHAEIDLVLCDITMPKMDGYEFVQRVRSNTNTDVLPVIFLTAKAEFESKIHGLELGADDYITKPFEFRELRLKLRNLLERQDKLKRGQQILPANVLAEGADLLLLKKLNMYLNEHIKRGNLHVNEVAEALHMSASTFTRQLKKISGKVPNKYIREFRLETAKQMISAGYGNLSEVALATGFASLSYFSTCYKQYFGQSPGSTT